MKVCYLSVDPSLFITSSTVFLLLLLATIVLLIIVVLNEHKVSLINGKNKKWLNIDGEVMNDRLGDISTSVVRYKVGNRTYEKTVAHTEKEMLNVYYLIENPTKMILADKKQLRRKTLVLVILAVVCLIIGTLQLCWVASIYGDIFSNVGVHKHPLCIRIVIINQIII